MLAILKESELLDLRGADTDLIKFLDHIFICLIYNFVVPIRNCFSNEHCALNETTHNFQLLLSDGIAKTKKCF